VADQNADALQRQIQETEKQLAEARARIPKHDVPAALILEIDELDEELARLRALAQESIDGQIARVEAQLAEVKARVPKHDVPASLIVEMDELDEELAHLRAQRKKQG